MFRWNLCFVSTELGANLAGEGRGDDEVVTSGVSSANSVKAQTYHKQASRELETQVSHLQEQNLRYII